MTEGIRSSQRSVRIWGDQLPASRRGLMDRFHTFYGSMLSQDLGSIVPYRDDEFRVEVAPGDDDETRDLVARALDGNRHHSLEDALAEFLRHFCAPTVVLCGEALYEVAYLSDPQRREVEFRLSPITAGTYRRFFGRYVETIPAEYAREHTLPRRIWLERADLAFFRLPWWRRRETERMMRVFEAAQRRHESIVDLTEKAQNERLPYDFKAHQDSIERVIARATSCIGWDARWSFREKQLEPYQVYRHLRFAAFKAELRADIISQLNAVLSRVGARLGRPMQLVIHGLPSAADLVEAEAQLSAGSRPLTELLRAYL